MKKLFRQNYKVFLIIILSIFVVILGFKVSDLQNKVDETSKQQEQISILLSGENSVMGYTCGVLSEEKAKELLQTDVVREYIQGPTHLTEPEKAPQPNIFWADSCRYQDSSNTAKYVEFYVSTFASIEDATRAFPDFFRSVNDKEYLDSGDYGQELVYDAGVLYLLSGNRIVQVAASNGNPAESKMYAQSVFEKLIN